MNKPVYLTRYTVRAVRDERILKGYYRSLLEIDESLLVIKIDAASWSFHRSLSVERKEKSDWSKLYLTTPLPWYNRFNGPILPVQPNQETLFVCLTDGRTIFMYLSCLFWLFEFGKKWTNSNKRKKHKSYRERDTP